MRSVFDSSTGGDLSGSVGKTSECAIDIHTEVVVAIEVFLGIPLLVKVFHMSAGYSRGVPIV